MTVSNYLSIWEIAHRWHDVSPDGTDPEKLPTKIQDSIRYISRVILVNDHTTLRTRTNDSNRSRWPLHPLWQDLQARVSQMDGLGVVRELDGKKLLDERMMRISISMYG